MATEVDHPIGHARNRRVVRDHHRRGAEFGVDLRDDFEHQLAGQVVERTGRLVAKQHLGAFDDCPCDRHPLLLATRQLRRKVIAPWRQPDPVDGFVDRHRVLRDVGDERQVLAHRQARDQVVELEHETDMLAPIGGEFALAGSRQQMVGKAHFPGCWHIEPTQDVEQRRLAAARCAEQHHEFAAVDFQVDIAQRVNLDLAAAVDLGQAASGEDHLTNRRGLLRCWRCRSRQHGGARYFHGELRRRCVGDGCIDTVTRTARSQAVWSSCVDSYCTSSFEGWL